MIPAMKIIGQFLAYGVFAAVIAYFSTMPAYTHLDPDQALIKLSFSHAGQPKGECHQRTAAELAELAPNMRIALDCPRERLPITVELMLDGAVIHERTYPPAGLWNDGPSSVYQRFPVAAGQHQLAVRLRDSKRVDGFDYMHTENIELLPRQNFVIDFRADTVGFIFR